MVSAFEGTGASFRKDGVCTAATTEKSCRGTATPRRSPRLLKASIHCGSIFEEFRAMIATINWQYVFCAFQRSALNGRALIAETSRSSCRKDSVSNGSFAQTLISWSRRSDNFDLSDG